MERISNPAVQIQIHVLLKMKHKKNKKNFRIYNLNQNCLHLSFKNDIEHNVEIPLALTQFRTLMFDFITHKKEPKRQKKWSFYSTKFKNVICKYNFKIKHKMLHLQINK